MKSIRVTLLTFLSLSLLFACSKEKSLENGGNTTVTAQWEFKENKQYIGRVDTAFIDDFGTSIKTLFLQGTSSDGQELLAIQVINIDPATPKTYKTPNVLFTYLSSRGPIYGNDITATGEFTLTITQIDEFTVAGIFNGKVQDSTGALKTVTEGKFTAVLKEKPVNPPPTGNGQATFWAKGACAGASNISVTLSNNQTGSITAFSTTPPSACGASGMASFTLPAGAYTWKAKCGSGDSTSGSITVVANQCLKQEVVFGVLIGNCRISDITYYDIITDNPGESIHAVYNASNQVTNVQILDSASGGAILENYTLTYPSGKIQINANQYFLLDASGRVKEFHGYYEPTDTSSGQVINKYTYDANGYMTRLTYEFAAAPGIVVWQAIMEYSNGNLTRITETSPGNPAAGKYETTYQYHTSPVKNFLNFLPSYEIYYFQVAINAGKVSQNAVKNETLKIFDGSGTVIDQAITNFDTYVIDPGANPYARSLKAIGDGNFYQTDNRIGLRYKCF